MINDIKKRNLSIDIIKTIAVISVISVHFFLNIGFYNVPVTGKRMFVMTFMRTMFMVCVPLFLIVTGFLSKNKVLSKKYYRSISRVLILYVLASIVCCIYKSFTSSDYVLSLKTVILETLSFTGSAYSWYVEMYIGLFLLIPFLNSAYFGLNDKYKKQVLVFTMIFLTTLPTVINSFFKILPFWWVNLFPITYYFIGLYLREYPIKINSFLNIFIFFLSVFVFSVINYHYNFGGNFKWSDFVGWGGYQNIITSALLFNFFINLDLSKTWNAIRYIFYKISELSFCIYLVSYIFDSYFYKRLNSSISETLYRLPYFFVAVGFVFIGSFILSAIINAFYKIIIKTTEVFKRKNTITTDKTNLNI